MATRTFNIGERSYYGRWKITTKGDRITVTGMDWDTREVRQTDTFTKKDIDNNRLAMHLYEISDIFHGDKMLDWVKGKI